MRVPTATGDGNGAVGGCLTSNEGTAEPKQWADFAGRIGPRARAGIRGAESSLLDPLRAFD